MEETRRIIDSGNDFLGKSPYFQHLTLNHSNAFNYISRNTRSPINTMGVLELHKIVMRNIDKEAGSFRDKKTRNKIQGVLENFIEKLNNSPNYHVIEKAALIQSYFFQIRPFNYGTGSTARLVAKWILNHQGYIFGLKLNDNEIRYYRKCAEKSGQGTIYPIVNMMAKCVEDTLDLLNSKVKTLSYIPIEDAMKKNNLSIDQMIERIKRGDIKAFKKDEKVYVIDQEMDNVANGTYASSIIKIHAGLLLDTIT